jgi:hypothetical protein
VVKKRNTKSVKKDDKKNTEKIHAPDDPGIIAEDEINEL